MFDLELTDSLLSHYNASCPQLVLTEGENYHAMESVCQVLHAGRMAHRLLPGLKLMSQGETREEAKENLEEAFELFFKFSSYIEVMSHLSRVQPASTPQASIKPIPPFSLEKTDQEETVGEISLAYA